MGITTRLQDAKELCDFSPESFLGRFYQIGMLPYVLLMYGGSKCDGGRSPDLRIGV
jgi:hypothetical protein